MHLSKLKICLTCLTMLSVMSVASNSHAANKVSKQNVDQWVNDLLQVGPVGASHKEAVTAAANLQKIDVDFLPTLLIAFDQANPLAVNWLAGVVETVVAKGIKSGDEFPVKEIEKFVRERGHSPIGRELAFDVYQKLSFDRSKKMIPSMISDPAVGLRRKAVEYYISRAESKSEKKDAAKADYLKALSGASEDDQVKTIVKALKDLSYEVDIQKHFGYVNTWSLIGPFDNVDQKGFHVAYPPEENIDLDATYKGKEGEVEWKSVSTDDDYGIVNIADKLKPFKGAIVYATAEFHSDGEKGVEFRLSTPNAWKLWVNGELAFEREEYHRGTTFDQYRIFGNLKKGKNVILLKICQNEQEQHWAQKWQYQFRVCTLSGYTLPSSK